MFQRLLLALTFVSLPFAAAGLGSPAFANAPNGWDPEGSDFQGLPDNDGLSARFLIVSGPDNSTLSGGQGAEGETWLALTFDPAQASDPVRIALFDANSTGAWDQVAEVAPLNGPAPNVRYRLYADPTGNALDLLSNAAPGDDPTPVQESDAYGDFNGIASDSTWCSFYDAPASATPTAQTAAGTYRFLMRISLEPAPGEVFFDGSERCGHKVAFNGTYLLPANTVLGFAGGAVDERTIVVSNDRLEHQTFDPVSQINAAPGRFHYNGIIEFNLLGQQACEGDILLEEADADYQAPTTQGTDINNVLENPTGVPPDNVGWYQVPGERFPRDVSSFVIDDGGEIRWSLFPTGSLHTSPPTPTPAGPFPFSSGARTSFDVGQEPGVWRGTTLDQTTLLADPGLWCVRWESVDKANFIFMRFDRDVGTTPVTPKASGRFFCDADDAGRGALDANDGSLGVPLDASIQRVACDANGDPIPAQTIGSPIAIQTDASGAWSTDSLVFGACYLLDLTTDVPFDVTTGQTLPYAFSVAGDALDPETCEVVINVGFDCTQPLCGQVWCDLVADCEYVESDDGPIEVGVATVVIQPIDAQGDPDGAEIRVPITEIDWCVEDLPFGRYRVTMDSTLDIVDGCPESYTIDLDLSTVGSDATEGMAFAMVCPQANISGRVFCEGPESDCDGVYDDGVDEPIAGISVELLLGGQVLRTDLTDADGVYEFLELAPGTYTTRVEDSAANAALLLGKSGPTPATREALVEDEDIDGLDFAYCERQLSGRVFCEGPESDCDGEYDDGVDEPLAGIVVELLLGGQVVDTATTNAAGRYGFDGLAPDETYTVRVQDSAGNANLLVGKSGPTPTLYEVPLTATNGPANLDFAYCERMLLGRVFCEGPEADCDGTYDDGVDTPIAGVLVELLQGGQVLDTDTTDAEGRYSFSALEPGVTYSTRVADTPANDALVEGKAGPAPAFYLVEVPASGTLDNLDFAYCERAVEGQVFCEGPDSDCDGEFDLGVDEPIAGMTIELLLEGQVVDATTTGNDGRYRFEGLAPGSQYMTRVADLPANDALVEGKAGPSPGDWTFTVLSTGLRDDLDFAYCERAVSGRVFCEGPESDCDGVYDAGVDTPIEGIVVELLTGTQVVDSATTGADGRYSFTGIEPGVAYTTRVADTAANDLLLEGKTGPDPVSHTFTLAPAEARDDLDFAYCERAISGRVFCEGPVSDCDGIYEDGVDEPIQGVLVELVVGGQVVDTATTDAEGRYGFDALEVGGTYTTRVADNAANDALLDGKHGPLPALHTVTLGAADQIDDLDFAYCERQISGRVFCEGPDAECDFIYDDGIDTPIGGVLVELLQAGQVIDSTSTGADGRYAFDGLAPGETYTTRVADNAANDALLEGKTGPVPPTRTATPGIADQIDDLDFAYCLQQAMISGRVFCEGPEGDCDGVYDDGVDTPIAGVVVELVRDGQVIDTDTTDAQGLYGFDELVVPAVYTTRVADTQANAALLEGKTGPVPAEHTVDTGSSDVLTGLDYAYCWRQLSGQVFGEGPSEDCDGTYDAGVDTPFAGVLIELLAGGQVIDTTTTGADGRYGFDELADGTTYTTRVADTPENAAILAGYAGPSPSTQTRTLGTTGQNDDLDFAYCTRQVSGRVFREGPDADCDGTYDDGIDTPLPGVLVELLLEGQVVDSTTTDIEGRYGFDGLAPGVTYTTRVADNAANAALLDGLAGPTPATQTRLLGTTGQNDDLDFAYCLLQAELMGRVFCEGPTADCDGRYDAGIDTPIPGVTVELLLDGQVVDSTTTNAEGIYAFDELTVPATYTTRIADTAANDTLLEGKTGSVPAFHTVTTGSDDPLSGLDFAYCLREVSGTVYCEPGGEDCDGVYDVGVDTPIAGITVELLLSGQVIDTETTGADGGYVFTGLMVGETYTTRVADTAANAALLEGKKGPVPATQTRLVPADLPGPAALDDLDFGYCTELELTGRVWCEDGEPRCDGVYTEGQDVPVASLLIRAVRGSETKETRTDAQGRYRFDGLTPGVWDVFVAPEEATIANKVGPLKADGELGAYTYELPADSGMEGDFHYNPLSVISGCVWVDVNCDGIRQDDELEGIPGVVITLEGPIDASIPTNDEGCYNFDRLPDGTYTVSIGADVLASIELIASTPTTEGRRVVCGDVGRVDFGFCPPKGRIFGYVYEDPIGDCNGVLEDGDSRLPGMLVELLLDGQVIDTRLTDNDGFYEFTDLAAGDYTVRVADPDPNDRNITLATAHSVDVTLPQGGEEQVDFGYCTQRVCGRVWCEKLGFCDGIWGNDEGDEGIGGLYVELEGLSGDALGYFSETLTGPNGEYCFPNIPTGEYRVRVADRPENESHLVNVTPQDPTQRFPLVNLGSDIPDQDFVYCEEGPCEQDLCVRVFIEPRDQCDDEYTEGVDRWLANAQVFVAREGDNEGYIAEGYTDADGSFCWEDMEPGVYVVYVGAYQTHLGLPECESFPCRVVLRCNEPAGCVIGTCPKCPTVPCCEGDIHEMTVEVDMWCPTELPTDGACLPFGVALYDGCDDNAAVIDRLETVACQDGPMAKNGFDGLIRVESLTWQPWGTATVRLRITASESRFQDGAFGLGEKRIVVRLGDDVAEGCAAFRCETLRPGTWFTTPEGTPVVPCDHGMVDPYSWVLDPELGARFLVLEVLSAEAWRACNGLPPLPPEWTPPVPEDCPDEELEPIAGP